MKSDDYSYVFDYSLDNNISEHLDRLREIIYQMSQNNLDIYAMEISKLIVKYDDDELFYYFAKKISNTEYYVYSLFLHFKRADYITFLINNNKIVIKNIIDIACSEFDIAQKMEWTLAMLEYLKPDKQIMREIGTRLIKESSCADERILRIFLGDNYQSSFP